MGTSSDMKYCTKTLQYPQKLLRNVRILASCTEFNSALVYGLQRAAFKVSHLSPAEQLSQVGQLVEHDEYYFSICFTVLSLMD